MVLRVCRRQINDLNVDLYILWSKDLTKVEEGALPPDLLIVDDNEAVIVRIISDEFYETLVYADARVRSEQARFKRYLAIATPAERALPPSISEPAQTALPSASPALPVAPPPEEGTESAENLQAVVDHSDVEGVT
jgi:hypothetical protein